MAEGSGSDILGVGAGEEMLLGICEIEVCMVVFCDGEGVSLWIEVI